MDELQSMALDYVVWNDDALVRLQQRQWLFRLRLWKPGTHANVPRVSGYTQVHITLLRLAMTSLAGYSRTSNQLRQFDVGHSRSEQRAVLSPYFRHLYSTIISLCYPCQTTHTPPRHQHHSRHLALLEKHGIRLNLLNSRSSPLAPC